VGESVRDSKGNDWFGQPRGLTILFLTDAWSLFSFFGMRALLVYYMMKQLHMSQGQAALIYGSYAAFSNFMPLAGGFLSDRWLGRRTSVTIGGSIMAVGHFMMASEFLFYPALVTILVGYGLFMPNLPSQISGLYAQDDPRRSSAYNVYYAGINLGGFLAPLACGTIGEVYGWHYGFALAGFGMMIAMLIYWAGRQYLPSENDLRRSEAAEIDVETIPVTNAERFRVLGSIALTLLVMRIAYDQQGNVLAVWTDQSIDRMAGLGWTIPMTWFQSINPMIIFLLTPILVARWRRQAERQTEWSSVSKMAFGALLIGLSFLVLSATAHFAGGPDAKVSWLWLAFAIAILTLGELFVLPVALGMFGRLAPSGSKATIIACYFIAAFFGNLLAGYIGSYWTLFRPDQYFLLMFGICIVASLGFRAIAHQADALETRLKQAM
jgi:proton-dependent oligopeptide transporter, POT family